MEIQADEKYDFIITAVGMSGKDVTYYIAQDGGTRKIMNHTGVFTSEDIYDTFDYGKTIYAYAIASDGTETEPKKLKLTKAVALSESTEAFLKSSKFSLMGEDGQKIEIPEDIPLVGGGKISLEAFKAPIGVDINGSDVKISVGVDIFSAEKEYTDSWKKEKDFKDFKDGFSTLISGVNSAKEEIAEFQAEVEHMDKEKAEAEFGDVMFSLINAARLYKINPDNALEQTNQKFIRRFNYVEAHSIKEGKNLKDMSLEEMDKLWNEAKGLEKK